MEGLAFHTRHLLDLLALRLNGGFGAVFALSQTTIPRDLGLPHVTREQFLTSPDLLGGLFVFAAFIALTVWLRRRAEPV